MTPIPFEIVAGLCAAEGLTALAVLSPLPEPFAGADLARMLADGVGDMTWITTTLQQRGDPRALLPTARSLVVVAFAYTPTRSDETLRRARYGAGKDYHTLLRPKLGRVAAALSRRHPEQTWDHRATTDSAPITERALATRAGLGWIGRNALLLAPDAGSWRLLGTLLTEAPLEPRLGEYGADRCGACTACETRCPTAALKDRRVLSERCISYLTIEHRGVITRDLAQHFEGWWFGCDLCQEVCPWNRFATDAIDPRLRGDERDADLLAVTATTFDTHFAGRPIRRLGYERFHRNLLVALWSLGRANECGTLLAEGLPLVLAQARELGLDALAPIPASPPCS